MNAALAFQRAEKYSVLLNGIGFILLTDTCICLVGNGIVFMSALCKGESAWLPISLLLCILFTGPVG